VLQGKLERRQALSILHAQQQLHGCCRSRRTRVCSCSTVWSLLPTALSQQLLQRRQQQGKHQPALAAYRRVQRCLPRRIAAAGQQRQSRLLQQQACEQVYTP
jgi:hypothetical protein